MSQTMFQQIRGNKIKSVLILFLFIIIIGFLGGFIGFIYNNIYIGLILAIFAAVLYSLIVYYSGKSMILAMTGARQVTKQEYPHLYHAVEGLSIAAGIPTPKAYVIDDSALNAFATGRNHNDSIVVVTTGLLNKLNREELEGVISHELSHIKNYDIRVMMLTAVLVGITVLLSDFLLRSVIYGRRDSKGSHPALIIVGLVLALLTPVIGELIKLAVSRKREYLADASGASLTRYPEGLASALEKISKDPDPLVDKANKATAHLFISTPFRKKTGFVTNLFSTHPPLELRIKKLREM